MNEFKPFDKVIVRNSHCADTWTASIFSHYEWLGGGLTGSRHRYAITIDTAMWDECLPYEDGLAKYLGTKTDLAGASTASEGEEDEDL